MLVVRITSVTRPGCQTANRRFVRVEQSQGRDRQASEPVQAFHASARPAGRTRRDRLTTPPRRRPHERGDP
ncbi:hypothetical protein CPE01_27210 [Cellulomonas persica]|uniref:Uncharacterized protein n=1 Tax=Cellulomonas persica TaxID=76861 RepID=A0A510UWG2_9CELL|nr:hypothetical protein CPE01_27210 [Cellulomonas persica]